jgi:hypothetical protein
MTTSSQIVLSYWKVRKEDAQPMELPHVKSDREREKFSQFFFININIQVNFYVHIN